MTSRRLDLAARFAADGGAAARMRKRPRAVRWGLAGNIVVAWIVTMAAALMAAAASYVGRLIL